MRTFGKMLKTAVIFCAVMMGLCSFLYPMALTGVSQLTMKEKANGSLINKNGDPVSSAEEAVGSELLGQAFTEDYYFRRRKMVSTEEFPLVALIMETPIRI